MDYARTKAAPSEMSVGLAEALGPTIRVNTLMPGAFQADVSKARDFGAVAKTARRRRPCGGSTPPRGRGLL